MYNMVTVFLTDQARERHFRIAKCLLAPFTKLPFCSLSLEFLKEKEPFINLKFLAIFLVLCDQNFAGSILYFICQKT